MKVYMKIRQRLKNFISFINTKKIYMVLLSICVFSIAGYILLVMTSGKYVETKELINGNTKSANFYFEADKFTGSTISSAEPVIIFGLRNYKDDNNITPNDIQYMISVQNGNKEDCTSSLVITDSGNPTVETNNLRTLANNKNENIITISGFSSDTYTVTVTSTSPYTKKMSETYTITHLDDVVTPLSIDATSNLPYITVTVTTNDFTEPSKNFNLSWNSANENPDKTCPGLKGTTSSSVTLALAPNSTYTYRFIKISDSASSGDFLIDDSPT